jgi:hypothetical protein
MHVSVIGLLKLSLVNHSSILVRDVVGILFIVYRIAKNMLSLRRAALVF